MSHSLHKIILALPSPEHLRATRNIIHNYLLQKGTTPYEPLTGHAIGQDANGYLTDICFLDSALKEVVVVEMINSQNIFHNQYEIKVKLFFEAYKVQEVFVYLYDLEKWIYFTHPEQPQDNISYSPTLDFDFAQNVHLASA